MIIFAQNKYYNNQIMKSLVLESDKNLVLHTDAPIPNAVAENSILVKVASCGICGSDIKRGFGSGAYHYPLVMGHEFSAFVAEDAADGTYKKGDRVAVFPLIPTNLNEPAYQTGDYAQLKEYNYFGSRCDGAFAEFVRVPIKNLFRVPDHVDMVHASMTEPAAVALHGVRKMNITAGDFGVVIGAGPVGNMTAQWLKIHGCKDVAIVDIDEKKLKIAQEMGFITINSLTTDAVKEVFNLTNNLGANRVVEACGLPQTFLQALNMASRNGEVVFMGNIIGEFKIGEKDFSNLLRREVTIYGTWNSKTVPSGNDDWTTALNYMDKGLIVAPLISDVVPIEKGKEIFDSILEKKKFHNKVIIQLSSEL
jgi:L-iditol 2-dehydrogenase/galactitol-1-phosphate 5-dehydrogenase